MYHWKRRRCRGPFFPWRIIMRIRWRHVWQTHYHQPMPWWQHNHWIQFWVVVVSFSNHSCFTDGEEDAKRAEEESSGKTRQLWATGIRATQDDDYLSNSSFSVQNHCGILRMKAFARNFSEIVMALTIIWWIGKFYFEMFHSSRKFASLRDHQGPPRELKKSGGDEINGFN